MIEGEDLIRPYINLPKDQVIDSMIENVIDKPFLQEIQRMDEVENKLTFDSLANGRAALLSTLLFSNNDAPSFSTSFTILSPSAIISSTESKSLVNYCALLSGFCNSQNEPPANATIVLSNILITTEVGIITPAKMPVSTDKPLNGLHFFFKAFL